MVVPVQKAQPDLARGPAKTLARAGVPAGARAPARALSWTCVAKMMAERMTAKRVMAGWVAVEVMMMMAAERMVVEMVPVERLLVEIMTARGVVAGEVELRAE